jgi:hypothetical protein
MIASFQPDLMQYQCLPNDHSLWEGLRCWVLRPGMTRGPYQRDIIRHGTYAGWFGFEGWTPSGPTPDSMSNPEGRIQGTPAYSSTGSNGDLYSGMVMPVFTGNYTAAFRFRSNHLTSPQGRQNICHDNSGNGKISYRSNNGSIDHGTTSSGITIVAGTEYHFVCVSSFRSTTSCRDRWYYASSGGHYVVDAGSDTTYTAHPSSGYINFFLGGAGGSYRINGLLSDFCLWDRELSPSEAGDWLKGAHYRIPPHAWQPPAYAASAPPAATVVDWMTQDLPYPRTPRIAVI